MEPEIEMQVTLGEIKLIGRRINPSHEAQIIAENGGAKSPNGNTWSPIINHKLLKEVKRENNERYLETLRGCILKGKYEVAEELSGILRRDSANEGHFQKRLENTFKTASLERLHHLLYKGEYDTAEELSERLWRRNSYDTKFLNKMENILELHGYPTRKFYLEKLHYGLYKGDYEFTEMLRENLRLKRGYDKGFLEGMENVFELHGYSKKA